MVVEKQLPRKQELEFFIMMAFCIFNNYKRQRAKLLDSPTP
jgi:hypothetical protein